VGQGTQSFQTGDWVYINPWIQARCSGQDTAVVHKGRGPLTPLSHALSQIYLNGTFAKQTIAPGESLVSLPQLGQQSPSHWTALEPLHLAWALLIDAGFSPGQHVAIVDPSGPTAAAAALLASALGAGHLSLVTRSGSESAAQDETLREALKAGGSHAWICGEPDTRLLDSADLVVDAQDRWIHHDVRLSQLGFDLVKRGGTVVWSGASKAVVDMPFQKLVRKSVRLLASEQPSDHTLGKLVAWLDSRRDILSRYQVKSHSLSMHGDAFVHARGRLGLHLTTLLP
jgi:threonine dehydrogenase-like Zn-dependent dehydrogenase